MPRDFEFEYRLITGEKIVVSCHEEAGGVVLSWGITTPPAVEPVALISLMNEYALHIDSAAHIEWMNRRAEDRLHKIKEGVRGSDGEDAA